MAAEATNQMQSIVWNFFFTDLEQLVLDYEQLKASNFTTNVSLDETLLERFENAVQALENVPHIQHSHNSKFSKHKFSSPKKDVILQNYSLTSP